MAEGGGWHVRREHLLFTLGVIIILTELVNAEILGRSFHYEFLVLGGGLVGVGVTQFIDRGGS